MGANRSRVEKFWAWAVVALAAVLIPVQDFFLPINRDGGMFAYGGWRILHGELPYIHFWDNKLPGVFYINALAIRLFGASPGGIVVFQMIYGAATALVFFAVARRLCGKGAALIATLLFVFYHGSYGLAESGNYTETYVGLPVLLAVMAMLKWSTKREGYALPILAGALGAAAGLIKQPAASIVPAAAIFALMSSERRKSGLAAAGAVLLGAVTVAALLVAWMAHNKLLHEAAEANLVFNRLYLIDAYTDGLKDGMWNLLLGCTLVALPLVGAVVGIASRRICRSDIPGVAWLLTPWFVFDLAGLAMGGRFVNHYFIAILTSALLLTAITIDRIPRSKRAIAVAVGAGLFLFFGPVWSVGVSSPERSDSPVASIMQQECHILRTIVVKRLGEGSTLPAEDLAIWLRARTRPSDTIYIWGWDTRTAFLAQRAICSRYLHMHPIGASGFDRNARIRELARDIETRRPKYIVDESPIMPNTAPPLGSAEAPPSTCKFFRLDGYEPVKEVVAKHYRQVATVSGCVVYGLKGRVRRGFEPPPISN